MNEERLRKGIEATHFFLRFLWADCDKICVENPIPSTVYCLPKYNQIIQPWMFGHPLQKKTCLWLKGLPNLKPTEICEERQSSKVAGNWFNRGGKERQKNRAKTFSGIAKAMAEQWGVDMSGRYNVILNGTPLPKGHGDLIDRDALSDRIFCNANMVNAHTCFNSIHKSVEDAPTIIEADKEQICMQ